MKNHELRKYVLLVYILTANFQGSTYGANIVADNTRNSSLQVDKTPNGIDLVNINAPNQKGISHNVFKDFNVDKKGVILNNGTEFTNSQLGGLIYGNQNLQKDKKTAALIINEISGVNKSKIEGFTEIAGKKADYILSNPNGIYINGAGFINTGRVTFTTGIPTMNKFGDLKGFDVNNGTIVVGSSGVDTRNISMFDMISRTLDLQGAIYGGENINIILGRNEYDYKTGEVSVKVEDGAEKPKLSLDGKALGSLYSGRIFLRSTEKGVGVNSEGEMFADTRNLEILANGDVALKSAIAKDKVTIKSENLTVNEKVISEKDINIKGNDIVNNGKIASNEALSISGGKIDNKNTINSNAVVTILGDEVVNEGTITSDKSIKIIGKKVENKDEIASNDEVKIESNKINNTGKINSVNSLSISGKEISNEGELASNDIVEIIGNEIKNTGKITSVNALSIKGKKVDNGDTIASNDEIKIESDEIRNTGKISSVNSLSVLGKEILNEGDLSSNDTVEVIGKEIKNTGKITSINALSIKGEKVDNRSIIASNDEIKIESDEIKNIGKISSVNSLSVLGKKILNEGELTSNDTVKIKSNKINNTGKIQGSNILKIETKELNNSSKILGSNTEIKSNNILNSGIIFGKNLLKIVSNLINTGDIKGNNNTDILGDIKNNKNINTQEQLNIKGNLINEKNGEISGKNSRIAGNIVNDSIVIGEENLTIDGQNIDNRKILSSDNLGIKTSKLDNSGEITSETLKIDSLSTINNGTLYGKNSISLNSQKDLQNNKLIQSEGQIDINSDKLNNTGDLYSGDSLTINSSEMENKGKIISENIGIYNIEKIKNENILQGKDLKIKDVENTGTILSKGNLNVEKIRNSGNISVLDNINVSNSVENRDTGKIISNSNIQIKNSLSNIGVLSAKGDIELQNTTNSGKILSDGNLVLRDLDNNGGTIEGNNISILNQSVFNNTLGEIKAFNKDSILSIKSEKIENQNGVIASQGIFSIDTNEEINLDKGKYIGKKELNIKARSLSSLNNFENAGDVNIELQEDMINKNRFVSGGDLKINAKNLNTDKSSSLGSIGKTSIFLKGALKNLGELVFGKGKNEIKSSILNNEGFLIANDDLNIEIENLENSGQITGARDLNIKSENDILNKDNSLIFSGNKMNLVSKNSILNNKAEIYSGDTLEIKSKNIRNLLGSIESIQSMRLESEKLENLGEFTGSYTKKKVNGSESSIDVSKLNLPEIDKKLQDALNRASRKSKHWKGDKYLVTAEEGVSNYKSKISNIKSGGDIEIDSANILNKEGNIIANNNINIIADSLYNDREFRDINVNLNFRRDYKYKKRLRGSGSSKVSASTVTQQRLFGDKTTNITAGGDINITAKKVGNGEYTKGTTIINPKSSITKGMVFNTQNDVTKSGTIQIENYIDIPKGDKGLFKVNTDLVTLDNVDNKIEKVNRVDKISGTNKIGKIGEVDKEIIANNRKTPKFSYLIETNVKFIDKKYYLGSGYFFSRIKFEPEKDTRLLGDSFYETTIVNKAIFEATGKRYLKGVTNDKEQMRVLYDNSIKAMEDFNLSVGVSLNKNQINNLKNDLIWYVEEEVNGVVVLVPKVYLSKETLASLENVKGNQVNAGKELNINALTINNTGSLIGEKEVIISTDTLINESMKNGTYASIKGDKISIFSKDSIINRGGNIQANKDLDLTSKDGSILNETKVVVNKNNYKNIVTDVVKVGNISGENIKIDSGRSFINSGGKISADENIDIKAAQDINLDTIETVTRTETGSSRKYTINEKIENIGSRITGENISIKSGRNINIIGSDVVAEKDLIVKAKDNVNVIASVDSESTEKYKSSKGVFSSKESVDRKYNEKIKESNLIAGEIADIKSGNNVNIIGSNITSEGKVNIESGNNVVITSGLEGSSESHEKIKSSFLGLSGNYKKDKDINYKNTGSYIGAGEDVNIKAKKDTTIIASNIESGKDINIKAGNNVNIIAADDITEKESERQKVKASFFGSSKDLNFETGIKTKISKDIEKSFNTKVLGSNISSGKDVNIISEKDINIEASGIEGKNINIKAGNELNLTTREELTNTKTTKEKIESKVLAGLNASGIKESIDSIIDMVKGIKEVPKVVGTIKDLSKGKGLNESLDGREDSINAMNNWINGPTDGGVSAGIYANVNISRDKTDTKVTNTVGSKINSGKDVNLKTDVGDMNFKGVEISSIGDINIDSGKDINVSSGKNKNESKNTSESLNGQLNLLTAQISGGVSLSKGESKEESNINSKFISDKNINISGKDLRVKGGNIEGEKIKIDVDNLIVESIQDKSSSSNKSLSLNGSSDNKNNTSTGAGITVGDYDKKWVTDQSSIKGRESSEITVKETTHLSGGVLGGKDTILNTGSLSYEDVKDYEKGMTVGISGNIRASSKDDTKMKNKTEGTYSAEDREQINRATIGEGKIIIGGKEESPEGLNRDESKSQEITKDIKVKEIKVAYSNEKREWKDVKTIMSEYGAELDETFKYIFEKVGIEYKGNLSGNFGEGWNELEKIVGKNLKQDLIGIIPMEANSGGIYDQSIRKADAEIIEIEITPTHKEKLKESENISVNVKLLPIDSKNIGSLDFGNGILNFKYDIASSGSNQALALEQREALARGETVKITTYYNPSHGFIADSFETAIDILGFYSGGKIGTGNARKLANEVIANPNILNDYTAHSQGSAIAGNAIMIIIEEGKGDLLRGKKITFNGSPLNMKKMEKLSKEYGFEFDSRINKKDPVGIILGMNMPNTKKEGHTNGKDAYNTGYSKTMKDKDNDGIQEEIIKIENFHNVKNVETVNGKLTNTVIDRIAMKFNELMKKKSDKKEKNE